jgi:hypothetical protein
MVAEVRKKSHVVHWDLGEREREGRSLTPEHERDKVAGRN